MSYTSPAAWSTSSSASRRLPKTGLLVLASLLPLLLAACGGSSTGGGSQVTPQSTSQAAASPATSAAAKVTAQPAGTTPAGVASDETVRFSTQDGLTITGHLYSAPGPKRRLVIFAVAAPSAEEAWQSFARELANSGVAALTVQFPLYMEASAGARLPSLMDKDLESAVAFMASRDYPLIYVVGDFTEGTAGLKLAARRQLAGVVAVSAPNSFGSLDVRNDVASITVPKLFVASRGGDSASADFFARNASEPKQSQLYDGTARGSELLSGPNAAAFKQLLTDFVTR